MGVDELRAAVCLPVLKQQAALHLPGRLPVSRAAPVVAHRLVLGQLPAALRAAAAQHPVAVEVDGMVGPRAQGCGQRRQGGRGKHLHVDPVAGLQLLKRSLDHVALLVGIQGGRVRGSGDDQHDLQPV